MRYVRGADAMIIAVRLVPDPKSMARISMVRLLWLSVLLDLGAECWLQLRQSLIQSKIFCFRFSPTFVVFVVVVDTAAGAVAALSAACVDIFTVSNVVALCI